MTTETYYPSSMHLGFQYWPRSKTEKHAGVGWARSWSRTCLNAFTTSAFWTPTDMVYEG
jgi:hypothetical protein